MQLGISKRVSKNKKESAFIMRKQTKIAAIVSAAALLALGASITSFAAVRGTWRIEDGEWKCYDKNGEAYENVFAVSNGKEYYVGEDGLLVRSDWVEYDSSYYFVNSAGQKITNDWRLTAPYDDPDADEEWYYFQSTGKRAENKKITWKGKTYYFDSDGKMLTGWVTAESGTTSAVNEANSFEADNTYYCDETGARVQSAWVEAPTPETQDDDADADYYNYYMKSSGKAATGKQANIKGLTYFFDAEGRMLTGWVAYMSDSKAYKQIDKEGEEDAIKNYTDVYYVGDSDKGYAKKNKWVKLWAPLDKAGEEEDDLAWFYFEKDGKVYKTVGTAATKGNEEATKYKFEDGRLNADSSNTNVLISKKKVNSKDYWVDEEGKMVSGFWKMTGSDDVEHMFYFGGKDDGSMKTGSQTIADDAGDSYKFYFSAKTGTKGEGITGNQSGKLYYFGRLVQAVDYKYQIAQIDVDGDGLNEYFIVNSNGSIQHNNSQYKEDGDVLIDARNIKDSTKASDSTPEECIGQYVKFRTESNVPALEKYAIDLTYDYATEHPDVDPKDQYSKSVHAISAINNVDIINATELMQD